MSDEDKTPYEEMGFDGTTVFEVLDNINGDTDRFPEGTKLRLHLDNGTGCPEFESEDKVVGFFDLPTIKPISGKGSYTDNDLLGNPGYPRYDTLKLILAVLDGDKVYRLGDSIPYTVEDPGDCNVALAAKHIRRALDAYKKRSNLYTLLSSVVAKDKIDKLNKELSSLEDEQKQIKRELELKLLNIQGAISKIKEEIEGYEQ